jgi:glyoxylase-like metal-dependent hydrolase (beta-lactamase superfamily II)
MLRQIVPGIFAINGLKTGRAYLVEGDRGELALVDTSTGGVGRQISSAIAERGHPPEALRAIIATHYHYDHTGNAEALRASTGAQLYVHEHDAAFVDGTTPWMGARGAWSFLEGMGPEPFALKVDRIVRDGDVLPFAGGLRVIHAPGHTPGHMALYAEARRVLFAGDALMNILGLRLPMALASHDMTAARRSVRKLAQLEFDIALPGHGVPIIGRASEKLAAWARNWL